MCSLKLIECIVAWDNIVNIVTPRDVERRVEHRKYVLIIITNIETHLKYITHRC